MKLEQCKLVKRYVMYKLFILYVLFNCSLTFDGFPIIAG